ncbi:MAG: protealysin inhibitor emfourin [Chloroflexota bacterium]
MRIHFEKSGGFTGIGVSTTVDTSELPPDQAARLLEELDASGILEQPPETLESVPDVYEPDVIIYELTLQVGGYEHTYCMTDESVPETAQPLFRQLTLMARRSPYLDD